MQTRHAIFSAAVAVLVAFAVPAFAQHNGDQSTGPVAPQSEGDKWQKQLQQFQQKRWRRQARLLVNQCKKGGQCSPEMLQAGLDALQQASQQADLDARKVGKVVRKTTRQYQHFAAQRAAKTQRKLAQQYAKQLKQELRLQNRAQNGHHFAPGQQKKHAYQAKVKNDKARGGKYGGKESNGNGYGLDKKQDKEHPVKD